MKREKKREKKKICKCFSWALDLGDQGVKDCGLLGVLKPEDRQYYQLVKMTIQ